MEIIKRIFKSIWNFFFGKRPTIIGIDSKFKEQTDVIIESKIIEQKVPKPQIQFFRNQQLIGKVYQIGKSRFKIKNKIGVANNKFKYHVEKLTSLL